MSALSQWEQPQAALSRVWDEVADPTCPRWVNWASLFLALYVCSVYFPGRHDPVCTSLTVAPAEARPCLCPSMIKRKPWTGLHLCLNKLLQDVQFTTARDPRWLKCMYNLMSVFLLSSLFSDVLLFFFIYEFIRPKFCSFNSLKYKEKHLCLTDTWCEQSVTKRAIFLWIKWPKKKQSPHLTKSACQWALI